MQASDGNLYGTTESGAGNGSIFKITPSGEFTTVHVLKQSAASHSEDGEQPNSGLVEGDDKNLYGTARSGGKDSGYGTVFRVSPAGGFTILHTFTRLDGAYPAAGLTKGRDGFYGTTSDGGRTPEGRFTKGTVFRITASGEFKMLHGFEGSSHDEGTDPEARLLLANDGSLYGTTKWGGGGSNNYGTIFRITPDGTWDLVYTFIRSDGAYPLSGLIQTKDGAFYGLTSKGGTADAGTVYKLTVTVEDLSSSP